MGCLTWEQRGMVVNLDINKLEYFTITYPDTGMKKSYVQNEDNPEHFEKAWSGPLRINENLQLCSKCGHYRSRRVRRCNNPSCECEVLNKTELAKLIAKEFKEKNGHILSCNGTRIKP